MDPRDALLARLAELGIETRTIDHPPLHTVKQSQHLRGAIPGAHTKNLFLTDKTTGLWLVTAEEETRVDLKALARSVGARKFSFGKPDALLEALGVAPGSVTPFALVNDSARRVQFVLDDRLMAREKLNFHPLTNEATTTISRDGFLSFLSSIGVTPLILALDIP